MKVKVILPFAVLLILACGFPGNVTPDQLTEPVGVPDAPSPTQTVPPSNQHCNRGSSISS